MLFRAAPSPDSGSSENNSAWSASSKIYTINSDGTHKEGNQTISAQQDNVTVEISADNPNYDLKKDNTFTITIDNSNSWTFHNWTTGQTKDLGGLFDATYLGNGKFQFKSKIDYKGDVNYKFQVGIAHNKVDETTHEQLSVSVKDDQESKTILNNQYSITVNPLDKSIHEDEIANAWANGKIKQEDISKEQGVSDDLAPSRLNNAHIMQYMIEWNWGKKSDPNLDPLTVLKYYVQRFSKGQYLLPDTIRVFRVYKEDIAKGTNSSGQPQRQDIKDVLTHIYHYDSQSGKFLSEDPNFEQFLKDHLVKFDDSTTGIDDAARQSAQHISYNDYLTARNAAKKATTADKTMPPKIDGIVIGENNMGNVTLSNGKTGKFDKNEVYNYPISENSDSLDKAHSTFLIQMDTYLPEILPDWTIPGHGPSIIYDHDMQADGKGYNESTSTGTAYNSDISVNIDYDAKLHFADITDENNIKNLSGTKDQESGYTVTDKDSSGSASSLNQVISTPITFDNVQDAIKALTKLGYIYVGTSNGNHTSGAYNSGDSIYSVNNDNATIEKNLSNYDSFLNSNNISSTTKGYGNFSLATKEFTLNFVKKTPTEKTETETQKCYVIEKVTYYYENGTYANTIVPETYAPSVDRIATYTRTRVHNLINNTYSPWTNWEKAGDNFDTVDFPVTVKDKDGKTYTIDKNVIKALRNEAPDPGILENNQAGVKALNVQGDLENGKTIVYNILVPYKTDETPDTPNPDKPTPDKPTPNTPTPGEDQPGEDQPGKDKPGKGQPGKQNSNGNIPKTTRKYGNSTTINIAKPSAKSSQKAALPQTSSHELSLIGLVLAGLGLFGLAIDRRRKRN